MFAVEYMILVFSLLLAGGLLLTLARMGAAGTLSRNRVIGIRTGATMQSDAAWYAAHKAIAPVLRACSWVQLAGAAVIVVLALSMENAPIMPIGLAFLLLPIIGMLIATATTAANEAHQRVKEDSQA